MRTGAPDGIVSPAMTATSLRPGPGPGAGAGARARALALAAAAAAVALFAALAAALRPEPQVFPAGVVACAHPEAARIGADVLRRGGNAVDAAVAVGFALAVCLPEAGNLGGGGFMIVRAPDGRAWAIDFRETAPARAHRDLYLDARGAVDAEASVVGHRAAAVPGTVRGLALALERFGATRLEDAVAPAARLAEDGFRVTPRLARGVASEREAFARFPYALSLYSRPDGSPLRPGDRLRQPDLARTLRSIARDGPDAFYEGWIADAIVAEMERGGGLIARDDLARYRPVLREPLRGRFRGHEIVTMPPPSSGGIVLLSVLQVLEPLDLGRDPSDPAVVHAIVEACKRAFQDRATVMGDPDFVDVPVARLLDPRLAAARRHEILGGGEQTTHFSVVDRRGWAVACTYTLNDNFGAKVAVTGAGFLLNDEMDDFSAGPGAPNLYGLVGGDANAIAPGKRPLSSMTPTIVVGPDGRVDAVVGARGGPRIISAVLRVLLGRYAFGLSPRAAVALPRFHHQWRPDRMDVEPRSPLPPATLDALRARGHTIHERPYLAEVHAIFRDGEGLVGVPDPRHEDGTALSE